MQFIKLHVSRTSLKGSFCAVPFIYANHSFPPTLGPTYSLGYSCQQHQTEKVRRKDSYTSSHQRTTNQSRKPKHQHRQQQHNSYSVSFSSRPTRNNDLHIDSSNWPSRRKQQNHSKKRDPTQSDDVDRLRPLPKSEWTLSNNELVTVVELQRNNGHVGAVERWGSDTEDGVDCFDTAQGDETQETTCQDNHPNAVERGFCGGTHGFEGPVFSLAIESVSRFRIAYLENGNA
jgi:hypothetical protein